MSLRLYDTATRSVREFVPLVEGKVGIYHCGLTVQGAPHIGHIRKEVVFDVLRRWLERSGHEVTVIANLTDIDDKILRKSAEAGVPWFALAYANERALHAAYDVLGCEPPTYEPRATGHVPEMVELMTELVERGHAYPAADGSGDVYFDVRSWPAYGELSNQRVDDMEAAADADPRGKRDPRDFALWKGHKDDEPETASWPTPYGRGRPGWHLECSAMVGKYLGPEFDIHGGGLDLRFPHHENELAQSRAAGRPFARYWMHNAMLNLGGSKMSKSVGNTMLVSEVVKRVRPVELRYYLVASHYRSVVEFSFEALDEAAAAYRRIEGFVRRADEVLGGTGDAKGMVSAEFAEAMDDDLSVPAALAALQGVVREGNKLLADVDGRVRDERSRSGESGTDVDGRVRDERSRSGESGTDVDGRGSGEPGTDGRSEDLRGALLSVRAMLDVLGLDPLSETWAESEAASDLHGVVERLVSVALAERQEARARKDYAAADRVRAALAAAGVAVEDTPTGPRWTLVENEREGSDDT